MDMYEGSSILAAKKVRTDCCGGNKLITMLLDQFSSILVCIALNFQLILPINLAEAALYLAHVSPIVTHDSFIHY